MVETTDDVLHVVGGKPLNGTIKVRGAKNFVSKAMVAALLAPGTSVLKNVPEIRDVHGTGPCAGAAHCVHHWRKRIDVVETTDDVLHVVGGKPLNGTIKVRGAKNFVSKAMVAALLAPGTSVLKNVPEIRDVHVVSDAEERARDPRRACGLRPAAPARRGRGRERRRWHFDDRR